MYTMSRYVEPKDQLILEIYVRDLKRSIEFYKTLGFSILRQEDNFVELKWEDSKIYLEQTDDSNLGSRDLAGNIRIMVPDVDDHWKKVLDLDLPIVKTLGNRSYGLRDFTIAGPDGIGIRFGTRIYENKKNE